MEGFRSTPSFDFDLWAWQHSASTHTSVEMRKYRDDHQQAQPTTWYKISQAIIDNAFISKVQLDVGIVTDEPSIQSMLDALRSLPNLETLHVQTLHTYSGPQTKLALAIVEAVAQSSLSLRNVEVEGLWLASADLAKTFCRLLQSYRQIEGWSWLHVQCASPEIETMIEQAWSKNNTWTTWKLAGHVPVQWLQAAVLSSKVP